MNILKGTRIELPVHYDLWMQGARYGVVTSTHKARNGRSAYVCVKLDALPKARRVKLWKLDFAYAKTFIDVEAVFAKLRGDTPALPADAPLPVEVQLELNLLNGVK